MTKLFKKAGFTMIELLIVIAVLGVLAVAVLAAINPIEQINRGRDTGSRSDAEQLLSGIDRYYVARDGVWPWMANADDDDNATIGTLTPVDTDLDDTDGNDVLDKLSTGGTQELKQSFINRITNDNYNDLNIYYGGAPGDSVYVCFEPQSGSFLEEAHERCTDGLPADLEDISSEVCIPDSEYICLP